MAKVDIRKEQSWLISASLVTIAIVAVGVVLFYASSILIPFVLAIFISLLISPVLDFQVLRLKMPRALAVTITLVIVLVILTILFIFVSQAIASVVSTAGQYSDSFIELAENLFQKIKDRGIEIDQSEIITTLQKQIPAIVTNSFGTAFDLVSSTFLVAIFVIFLLIGRNSRSIHKGIYADIDNQVRRYITIKVVVSTVTGVLVWAALAMFKLELAAVFGILAFLLNFIPSVGSIVATLLPIPIAVAQFDDPVTIIFCVAIPGAIQMTIGNGIEPKLMGKGLHLHPVTILLALAFWGLLWGIPGMFLSVPITAVIRIVLMQFDTFKPIGNLLAGELPKLK